MDNEQDYAEMNQQLEQMTLEALDRCAKVGGRLDDLYFLATQLGVGESFRKGHNNTGERA